MNSTSSFCLSKNLLLYATYTNETNVYVLQRNIFVAEVFFCKLEHTCFEVTDFLVFLEILYHLPYYEGAFVFRVVINPFRCHIPGHLFSTARPELSWNPPPNKYGKQRGIVQTEFFSLMHEKLKFWQQVFCKAFVLTLR